CVNGSAARAEPRPIRCATIRGRAMSTQRPQSARRKSRLCELGVLCVETCVVASLAASPARAQTTSEPAAGRDAIVAAAETSLREGELQIAESHYRSALMASWMVIGTLRLDERRLPEARDAFLRASTSAVDAKAALQKLALVSLQMGEPARAVAILTRLAGANPKDVASHRLLAQALLAVG